MHAATKDRGFRVEFYGGMGVLIAILWYLQPLQPYEMLFIGLGWILILITELQNSALEIALDQLHPDIHDAIGLSKDLAAAAVLTAAVFMAMVVCIIVYTRLA
jgi:diacylglycerol kinase